MLTPNRMLGVAFLTCTPSRWTSSRNRGRSMKKRARRMFLLPPLVPARRRDCAILSRDPGAFSGVDQSANNHAVVRRESRPDHSQTALEIPDFHLFRHYRPVL